LDQLIVERRGFEFLENGRNRGKGTLLLTAISAPGNSVVWLWPRLVFRSVVVTLEEPTPELDVWRQKYRAKFGHQNNHGRLGQFAFLEIMQALRRNELVAMLVDRPYLNSGVEVKFFDQPTLFSAAAARIWQHTDATIIPAFVLQLQTREIRMLRLSPIAMTTERGPEENTLATVRHHREFPTMV